MEDLSVKYDFRIATIADYDAVFESALHGFIQNEPHAMVSFFVGRCILLSFFVQSLDITPAQVSPLLEWIVKKCLAEPYSMVVVEKDTGKVYCKVWLDY